MNLNEKILRLCQLITGSPSDTVVKGEIETLALDLEMDLIYLDKKEKIIDKNLKPELSPCCNARLRQTVTGYLVCWKCNRAIEHEYCGHHRLWKDCKEKHDSPKREYPSKKLLSEFTPDTVAECKRSYEALNSPYVTYYSFEMGWIFCNKFHKNSK